jgi:hypothetical protein
MMDTVETSEFGERDIQTSKERSAFFQLDSTLALCFILSFLAAEERGRMNLQEVLV